MKRVSLYFIPLLIISFSIIVLVSFRKYVTFSNMTSIEVDDVNLILTFDSNEENSYCKVGKTGEWYPITDSSCVVPFTEDLETIYIKNSKYNVKKVQNTKALYLLTGIKTSTDKIYLAVGGTQTLTYEASYLGNIDKEITFSIENPEIISYENSVVTGLNVGTTKIIFTLDNITKEVDVTVTNLITVSPKEYDYDKPYLTCNEYTEEENDLIDEILASRVNDAGYMTRAGAVAAARFFTLEFPKRIHYFFENGRLSATPFVDGEGRYYHTGMYLNDSRYSLISNRIYGYGTWGCLIYSVGTGHKNYNGLDCSGFITWILKQAGYDPGDIGAGITDNFDLTDLGEKTKMEDYLQTNELKVGDLLGQRVNGGHIALIAGIDDEHVYVAESIWHNAKEMGALLKTYDKENFYKSFYWHVSMDEYYKEDGNLTDMWY